MELDQSKEFKQLLGNGKIAEERQFVAAGGGA